MSGKAGAASGERTLCIVLHDAATSTRAACVRTLAAVRDVAGEAPVSLLVVPRYHGETPSNEFTTWLGERSRRGDELALHGYTHRDEGPAAGLLDGLRRSHYTRNEGEFWALPRDEAMRRIDAGIAWFGEHGWPLAGFVAPAWLLGEAAWAAVASRPFEYTATLRTLTHLPSRAVITSQSVVYSTSAGWRRQTSCLWNPMVARYERTNPLLRLELHPRDADYAGVRRSWQGILERALRDRKPATVADFIRRTRAADSGSTIDSSTLLSTTAD